MKIFSQNWETTIDIASDGCHIIVWMPMAGVSLEVGLAITHSLGHYAPPLSNSLLWNQVSSFKDAWLMGAAR